MRVLTRSRPAPLYTWQTAPALVAQTIRRLKLLPLAYRVAFFIEWARHYRENRALQRAWPSFVFPPARLLWLTAPTTSYRVYLTGEQSAGKFHRLASEYLGERVRRIHEWGCGTASVIRHLPSIDPAIVAHASDYDARLIAWCQANVPNVVFAVNALEPPLPYAGNSFDVVYSRSVYTHLPRDLQLKWLEEQLRVVRPGGLVLLTMLGDAYKHRLTSAERTKYEKTGIVEHGHIAAGSGWFTTYNSPDYMEHEMLAGLEIVYKETLREDAHGKTQDQWIVRKPIASHALADPKR